jgi:CubicO group peptidase (beta-lactamase class C family)
MPGDLMTFIHDNLNNSLAQFVHESGFSGDISLYEADKVLFHSAYGYRDIPNKICNSTNTIFGIASGTKLFTAPGILTLVETGKLQLHTKVSSLFESNPEFIDPGATIRQLLCHTSGIFDYPDEEINTDFTNYKRKGVK